MPIHLPKSNPTYHVLLLHPTIAYMSKDGALPVPLISSPKTSSIVVPSASQILLLSFG